MLKVVLPLSRLYRQQRGTRAVRLLALLLALSGVSTAQAAARLVILPVTVGTGTDPEPALMSALAEGLRQNPQWAVEQGESIPSLAGFRPVGLTDADIDRLTTELDGAAKKASAGNAEALTAVEGLRNELRAASKKGPRGEKGDELLWRTSIVMVAGLMGKDAARARTTAEETTLLFPGRKPAEADKLSAAATELWKTSPELGARLTLASRPEGCEVFLDGRSYGKSPAVMQVMQGETYWAHARCAEGGSLPKKLVVPLAESVRQEVLDAEFERGFAAEGFRRIRFRSPQERRDLEESYSRRAAERFDADVVVLASVGELSGADWLNARLYLRSGFLNRQGLVRLEAQRANALGRYLATGKDVPGVLKPEEAGAMVAAARLGESRSEPTVDPWYTDIAGWSFLGGGAAVLGWGRWMAGKAADQQIEADELRGEPERRAGLYEDAQSGRFWGGVGTVGGLLLISTGVVLLLVPEYNHGDSELFAGPTHLPGGGGLILGGRF